MMGAILFTMLWLIETVVTYSLGAVALGVVAIGAFTAGRSIWSSYKGGHHLGHVREA